MIKYWPCIAAGALACVLGAQSAVAIPVIAYEWTEGGPGNGANSPHVSFHNATGPVLADDFRPAVGGRVVQVDWWGSAPLANPPNPDLWEITFHTDANGQPAVTLPSGGISQHFVNASGSDPDGDQVFFYSAAWTPQDVVVNLGTDYWFSVANSSGNTWTWANAGGAGPTVGSQQFNAQVSIGGLLAWPSSSD